MYSTTTVLNRTKSFNVLQKMMWRAITKLPVFDQMNDLAKVRALAKVLDDANRIVTHRKNMKYLKATCCDRLEINVWEDGFTTVEYRG